MMKIAYDHQIFSCQKYGGISRYIFELGNNLAQHTSSEINIISPIHVNEYLKNASSRLRVKGCMVPQIKRTGRIIAELNQLLSVPLLAHFKPDIVHETYYARTRIAPQHAKAVLTVHDMIHEHFSELFPACDRTAANKAIAVARADHIICISENTRRDLINILGVDPAKISVTYLGFSLAQPSKVLPVIIDHPYLLYVGQRDGYKNFDTLLQAYAASPDLMSNYDLVVFGGGVWRDIELVRARALGINISRLRNIQGDDTILASLYGNATLFIYPSRYEGFGIPPLEAMSFGCPVVSSNASSLPEVVGNAAMLFDPQSPSALLAAIDKVLIDSVYCQALIDQGYIRIQRFSWKRCAEQTFEVYKKVLACRH